MFESDGDGIQNIQGLLYANAIILLSVRHFLDSMYNYTTVIFHKLIRFGFKKIFPWAEF